MGLPILRLFGEGGRYGREESSSGAARDLCVVKHGAQCSRGKSEFRLS